MSSSPQQPTYIIPPTSSPNWKTPVLVGILVILAAAVVFLFVQLDHVRAENKNDMAKLTNEMNAAMERMRIDSSEEVRRSTERVKDLQNALAQSRRAAALGVTAEVSISRS